MVCLYCGKALSNEQSIALEAGPECAAQAVAIGAAVSALKAELVEVCPAALEDGLIQKRVNWYRKAMRANDVKSAQRAMESAKSWAALLAQREVVVC
jgi:hypothetical protein